VSDYISTEISTSKQKKFGLVTFVDSPGLVDGDMKYPFDVNKALLWLGNSLCIAVSFVQSPSSAVMATFICPMTVGISGTLTIQT